MSKAPLNIENFYLKVEDKIRFTRQQASDFAKQIADDFNPLHNIDAKRFCVPGDLLFAVILSKSGLHQNMTFNFSGMVSNETKLLFPEKINSSAQIVDENNKEYLNLVASGDVTTDKHLIGSLIEAYVGFSGHTFPHLLGELMQQHNVMINPERPMVMYESMTLTLDRLNVKNISLKLSSTRLEINGKRGNALLCFDLLADNEVIGHGEKHMLLSGLRDYCPEVMQELADKYNAFKQAYLRN